MSNRRIPSPCPFLERFVRIAFRLWTRRVASLHKPGDIAEAVDGPTVADPEPGSRAVPIELPFVDHFAQRRRVQQSAEFARS